MHQAWVYVIALAGLAWLAMIRGWQKTAIAAVFFAGMATAVTPVGAAISPVVQGLLSSVPDAASAAVTELAR